MVTHITLIPRQMTKRPIFKIPDIFSENAFIQDPSKASNFAKFKGFGDFLYARSRKQFYKIGLKRKVRVKSTCCNDLILDFHSKIVLDVESTRKLCYKTLTKIKCCG